MIKVSHITALLKHSDLFKTFKNVIIYRVHKIRKLTFTKNRQKIFKILLLYPLSYNQNFKLIYQRFSHKILTNQLQKSPCIHIP